MDMWSVALEFIKCVIPCISSEVGYIFSYKKNLQKLERHIEKLEETEDTIKHGVNVAERNGEKIFVIVQNWLKKANDTVIEAKKLTDIDGQAQAGCCMGKFPNPWKRNQLSQRFEEMIGEVCEIMENGKFDTLSYSVASDVTISPFCRGYEELDSQTSMLNEIKQTLKDPEIYMIGVHGMGGVGKTTLVKELAWQVKKDGLFGVVAIADITHSPNVKMIRGQIIDALLNRKLNEKESEIGRAAELRQIIKQEERILIILDDIWNRTELDLTKVGIPFGDEHNGCKLVVTSRDLNVLTKMGTQKEFNMGALQKKDSWNLFQRMAGDVVKEFNIKPIAEKVAKCCAGLPLLIVTIAKGLRKKDVTAWRDALIQLERFNHEELQKIVHPALELSYNYLEDDELKSLFLFIGSLGINFIHTGELFSCCWGLGFYSHMHTLTEARNRHFKLINDLRASSLLLDIPEWVRMHDVVRDVAKSIASRFHTTYSNKRLSKMKEWPMVDQLHKCHYIVFPSSYISELPEKLEFPELKLLLLYNKLDHLINVPNNFFFGMREVRTLSLYRMLFNPLPPSSLYLLINLRSLNLYGCNLGDIKGVEKLKNLEILSLEKSIIKELPREIGHLTQLRMLNLANCSELRVIPRNLISSLTCLEELYMGNCHIKWEVEGSKSESNNASLSELQNLQQLTTLDISILDTLVLPRDLQFLGKLERYNILIGYMWKWSLQWSGGSRQTSRTLKLMDTWCTNISLSTVEDLSFAKLNHVRNVLYEMDEEGFQQLKHLYIEGSDGLVHFINSRMMMNTYSAFPNLETLVLHCLNNMKEICHGPLPTHSFEKLRLIKVEGCDRLKNLFLYSVVRNLSQLYELEISNCKDMKEIIAMEHQDENEFPKILLPELHSLTLKGLPMLQSFCLPLIVDTGNPLVQSIYLALFSEQVVMPKLETLRLCGIDTFKIWDYKFPVHCIRNLTRLTIINCNRLTSLFSSLTATPLVKLQYIVISDCSVLKEIFVQQEKVEFPNLETLEINNMYDLKSIWPNQLDPNSFCKLKQINIKNCRCLDYVFPTLAKELPQLQILKITHCAMENIIEKSGSCNVTHVYLEMLSVWSCPNLKTIVPSSVLFQTLDQLYVGNCHGVVNIITQSTITSLPKLRILSIRDCDKLEEIYGSNNELDAPPLGEIAFMKLEKLALTNLPRLTSFCQRSCNFRFRSLQMVRLLECPMLETFCYGNLTTPSHTKVQSGPRQEDYWDGDLNTTIRTIFNEKNFKQDLSWSSKAKGE